MYSMTYPIYEYLHIAHFLIEEILQDYEFKLNDLTQLVFNESQIYLKCTSNSCNYWNNP